MTTKCQQPTTVAGTALVGLAVGEVYCGVSAGWPSDQARAFFEDEDISFKHWPRRARGLTVPIRRTLRKAGLHGIHTQTAMACAYADGVSPGEWLIDGFEVGAWRNFPRGFLSMAHRQRADYVSRLTNDVMVRPGPLGPAVSCLRIPDAVERQTATASIVRTLYGDELTALMAVTLGELLARLGQGESPTLEDVLTELGGTAEGALGLHNLEDIASGKGGAFGQYRQTLRALRLALDSDLDPRDILKMLVLDGSASDTAGAVAGAILSVRVGTDWCNPTELMAGQEILDCGRWLNGEADTPRTLSAFFEEESNLTREEMSFRDEMMAERRTSPRS